MKGVSVYTRKRSPYFYVAYPTATGKRKHQATKWRVDDPTSRRKVLDFARERYQEAISNGPIHEASVWENWVPAFLEEKYRGREKSLTRVKNAWSALSMWLTSIGVNGPAETKYSHAQEYLMWRISQKRAGGKKYSRNTAIMELKVMGVIQREAMKRGWCDKVVFEKMGLSKDPVREKPEITPEQDRRIREHFDKRNCPQWMRDSYEIAMAQGCRMSETRTPLSDISIERRVITFNAKGSKRFATRLHASLIPLVERRRKEGAEVLADVPRLASKKWRDFFDSLGLPDHSFHCTRVTVITKMARAGVPVQQAMAYVGHANETIHKIYQRLAPQDLSLVEDALS